MAAAVLGLLLLRDGSGTEDTEAASMSFVESAGLWYFAGFQD